MAISKRAYPFINIAANKNGTPGFLTSRADSSQPAGSAGAAPADVRCMGFSLTPRFASLTVSSSFSELILNF